MTVCCHFRTSTHLFSIVFVMAWRPGLQYCWGFRIFTSQTGYTLRTFNTGSEAEVPVWAEVSLVIFNRPCATLSAHPSYVTRLGHWSHWIFIHYGQFIVTNSLVGLWHGAILSSKNQAITPTWKVSVHKAGTGLESVNLSTEHLKYCYFSAGKYVSKCPFSLWWLSISV